MSAGSGPARWPADLDPQDPQALVVRCGSCDLEWLVHASLGGFRLRCRCGAWVPVALPAGQDPALLQSAELASETQAGAVAHLAQSDPGVPADLRGLRGWHGETLEPDASGEWSLRHAEYRVRQRWTSRTILELAAVMLAFWIPPLIIQLTTTGDQRAFFVPLASIATSILVLLVMQSGLGTVQAGLRAAAPRYYFEAGAACALLFFIGVGWVMVLRSLIDVPAEDGIATLLDALGLPIVFCVVAVGPGIFEELAFRGLIQGRVQMLMGTTTGVLVTGAAFALAHGVTLGFPLHAAAGVILCVLRVRSGSLYPGMLLHIGYNGAWVLTSGMFE